MEKRQIGISFGLIAPKISVQLREQKFKFDLEMAGHYQKLRESINYLAMNNLISTTEAGKATQKLFEKIRAHVLKKNKLTLIKK
jgi:hypothetical protein